MPSGRDRRQGRRGAGARRHDGVPRSARSASCRGGQKKRVFLARALAQEGRIILLDEPFTGVDVQDRGAPSSSCCANCAPQGHLMLVSTHNLGSVPDFCDQVVLLNRTVLAAGPTAARRSRRPTSSAPSAACCATSGSTARALHDDDDARSVTVLTDDERPLVFYGDRTGADEPLRREDEREDVHEPSCSSPFAYDYMLKAMWVSARWSAASAPSCRPI